MGIYKKGDTWFIDYYIHGRRKREGVGPSKTLAETVLKKRKVQIAEKKFLDIKRDPKIRFDDFADDYMERYSKLHKKSWRSDEQRLKEINAFFGGRYLFTIDASLIDQYKSERAKKVKQSTVNRELALLKHIFTIAMKWKAAKSNPVKEITMFKENNQRLRYLDKKEVEKLLVNCKGYLRAVVVVAINTGMRKGEILGLKWEDIDFEKRIIYLTETKNGEKREVPMNDMARVALMNRPKRKDSPFVFCRNNGRPFRNVRKSFLAATTKSGIINFRFHDLRHTFASHLAMSGIDLNTVRELMGHKSMRMTLRYAHLSASYKQKAVEILENNWTLFGHQTPSVKEEAEIYSKNINKIKAFSHMPR